MRRSLIAVVALALAPAVAYADEPSSGDPADLVPEYEEPLPDVGEAPGGSVGDRELGASVGAAIGGGVTPGGLRVAGDFLYQLSDLDWFDGMVQFTFGTGGARCFRDRSDQLVCTHDAADGVATDLGVGVRRFFGGQQGFRPWVRPAVGVRLSCFSDDDLTGGGLFVSGAGGVRARVTDTIAVGGSAALELGAAYFTRGLGPRLQLGLVVAVSVDFVLP
jgi:hypothetical protein